MKKLGAKKKSTNPVSETMDIIEALAIIRKLKRK